MNAWRFRAVHSPVSPLLNLALVLFSVAGGLAQTPEWIWRDARQARADEVCFFRKLFSVGFKARSAELTAAGDDQVTVYLNGHEVARAADWKKTLKISVTDWLREGTNVLAARVKNGGADGPAAVFVKLEVRSENNSGLFVISDKTWSASPFETAGWETLEFIASDWKPAFSLGRLGVPPWGDVLGKPTATPGESITAPPGFKVELLKSAEADEGSWICMAADDKGRLIISPEKDEAPLLRVTLDRAGKVQKTERLAAPVRAAMGLFWARDSLYLNGHGPRGVGLYRLVDADHDDQFGAGEIHLLKNFEGDNEHGYHAVALGPDGMIYVMNGNHTQVPPGIAPDSPYQNYAEDLLLPRQWDANGHAKGILAPGGYVLKTDPDGWRWELFCGGFRNAYDFDFNPDGELFTFDSDMEWDVGTPWYRPTRINHCVSGGEYGWRSGTGKWPEYYPDSLPGNVDIGLSSPTGVRFGTRSAFPPRYQRALFACDWNYGKIFAVHLRPEGASYSGDFETFIGGKPLNVTSLVFGLDGAMYFIIGGWRTQSGLYRVSYAGPREEEPPLSARPQAALDHAARQRSIRRALESFHGRADPKAVEFAWPHLDSSDRWLRYAARVAIESQDVSLWCEKTFEETRVNASINALLALARRGGKEARERILERVARLADQNLSEPQMLEALRVLQVCFSRLGKPERETALELAAALSRHYPSRWERVNRESCQLLVYLEAPDVISKTLALMAAAPSQEEQMHYAFTLRNAKTGWTLPQRRVYFSWFNRALRDYRGGNSFRPYLINIRNDAIQALNESERAELASILEPRTAVPVATSVTPRPFVKSWALDELLRPGPEAGGRSLARGKEAFAAAQCFNCHRVGSEGGSIGPDLTAVASRFNRHDLLENILFPSKVISDRYQNHTITKRDGEEVSGCITEETDEKIVLLADPLGGRQEEIKKSDIQSRAVSKLSAMPEGLLNSLTKDEILDLLAYLEAGGAVGGR